MSQLLEALRTHSPLPSWAPPPAAQPVHIFKPEPTEAPTIHQQRGVRFMGHLFFVTYSTDEDGAWVERVQISGAWWDVEEVLSLHMRHALSDQLCADLLEEAKEQQP